jgi:hypothetical protein
VCIHFLFGDREAKSMPQWFLALKGDVMGLQRFLHMEKITIKSFATSNTEQRPKDFRPFFTMSCLASTVEHNGHLWLDCYRSGANLRCPVLHEDTILTCGVLC